MGTSTFASNKPSPKTSNKTRFSPIYASSEARKGAVHLSGIVGIVVTSAAPRVARAPCASWVGASRVVWGRVRSKVVARFEGSLVSDSPTWPGRFEGGFTCVTVKVKKKKLPSFSEIIGDS